MSQTYLNLSHIRKSFGETVALDGISMSIRSGMVHTVFGENGSGKSTLVKILSGVLAPDSGTVEIDGRRIVRPTPKALREAGIATVFQEVLVAPNRSVTENVFLGQDASLRWKVTGTKRENLVLDVLRELSRRPFELRVEVGGLDLVQQHQISIARALLLEPRLLVLDESTAALDIVDRDMLFAAVRTRVKRGMSVLFVSHRMDEVLEISDEVTVLHSGKVVETLPKGAFDEHELLSRLQPEAAL